MAEVWLFRLLVLVAVAAFGVQMLARARLVLRAKSNFELSGLGVRLRRLLVEVLCQRRTIGERPVVGLAHAFVFWGFVAFGGYTAVEFLDGLGIVDLTGTAVVPPVRSRPDAVCRGRARRHPCCSSAAAFVRPAALP